MQTILELVRQQRMNSLHSLCIHIGAGLDLQAEYFRNSHNWS
jgi:hypothetical protein